jgi:lipoic acid synthetase
MQGHETQAKATCFPPWLRKRVPARGEAAGVRRLLAELGLATVCSGAHCPNLPECYARGTATFLILGDSCTRRCRFCAIEKRPPGPLRPDEPEAVAEAAARLHLRHVVITSVTRDDLPDGGAGHFARTIRAVRGRLPAAVIEVLTPDFRGDTAAIDAVLDARPHIFNHNVETVPRLYPTVRPEADYRRSLAVLAHAKARARDAAGAVGAGHVGDSTGRASPLEGDSDAVPSSPARLAAGGTPAAVPAAAKHGAIAPAVYTKSGLMVGLGETGDEVRSCLADLRAAGCDILTLGQYLAPSPAHHAVARFVEPSEFAVWETEARAMGFAAVAAGPFVRSSYQAENVFAGREDQD